MTNLSSLRALHAVFESQRGKVVMLPIVTLPGETRDTNGSAAINFGEAADVLKAAIAVCQGASPALDTFPADRMELVARSRLQYKAVVMAAIDWAAADRAADDRAAEMQGAERMVAVADLPVPRETLAARERASGAFKQACIVENAAREAMTDAAHKMLELSLAYEGVKADLQSTPD